MKKFVPPSSHSAAMNSEFTAAWRGRGRGIYSRCTKAPVGSQQPVQNVKDQHRLKVPTGAFVQGMHWDRVIPSPGANVYSKGTGSFHHLVPLMHGPFSTGSWYQPVPLFVYWHRFVPWRVLLALGASQKYRLLLQPVPMSCSSTGCNMRWYFWPGPLACFPVVSNSR